MNRRPGPPKKLALLKDLVDQDSILHQLAANIDFVTGETWPDEQQDCVQSLLKSMFDLQKQAQALIEAVPHHAAKNILHANANMLRMRDELRKLVPEAIACFKCYRLFVPAMPEYRGCQDCYQAYLATLTPRPHDHDNEWEKWHERECDDEQED